MGRLRLLTLSLALLATVSGIAIAATNAESRSALSDRSTTDALSPKLLTGRVTEVNTQAKTFTVAVTFSADTLSKLPTVGQIIDVAYTKTPDGRMAAATINNSKSNTF